MKSLLGALVLVVAGAVPLWAGPDRAITVTGRGSVEMVPDMATIRIGVERESRLAADALDETSAAVAAVIARLEGAGIAPRDMQTQGLSLQPVWSRRTSDNQMPPRITGFVARNGLIIRVRELNELGDIIGAVVSDGANTFNGLQFSVAEPGEAHAAARADAVKDAMAKAGQLAAAAGVTLGNIVTISESGGAARPVAMEMASARMADAVPVAAGEVSLSAQVVIVFEIADD